MPNMQVTFNNIGPGVWPVQSPYYSRHVGLMFQIGFRGRSDSSVGQDISSSFPPSLDTRIVFSSRVIMAATGRSSSVHWTVQLWIVNLQSTLWKQCPGV